MDNEVPILVTGEHEFDDPSIPVVLENPISDKRLQIAAKAYARHISSLCCVEKTK